VSSSLSRFNKEHLPFLSLFLALSVLGIVLYNHVSLSEQMPFFDQLAYVQKAKNFWHSVEQHKFLNPLNLEPSTRPPGTILMSYPLGFSENVHGFYFRSIFIPIVLFVSALWIVARPAASEAKVKWLLASLCLAFSTMPLFYQFEMGINVPAIAYWGLVDTLFASMAALATAIVIRGIQRLSVGLSIFGIFVSAFCLLVKPAGIIVMAVIFLIWVIYAWAGNIGIKRQFQTSNQSQNWHSWPMIYFPKSMLTGTRENSLQEIRRYVLYSLGSFFLIYGIVVWLCFSSDYFSPDNMAYGKGALELLKTEWDVNVWRKINLQIRSLFGWHWFVFLVVTCMLNLFAAEKQFQVSYLKKYKYVRKVDILTASGVMVVGLWFWIIYTGISQNRYFFPFALMSVTLCFPRITSFCVTVSDRYFKIAIVSLLCPFCLLIGLLITHGSPVFLQRLLGVNLQSGSFTDEVRQAKSLVEKARQDGGDLVVYFLKIGAANAVFAGVGQYAKVVKSDLPSFVVRGPVDWVNDSTLRFRDIAFSDYLVFKPILDSVELKRLLEKNEIQDFSAELKLFRAWLTTANANAGLETVSETSLRLVKVSDRLKFENALDRLKGRYKWREIFLDANLDRWIDRQTASALTANADEALQNIRFSDEFMLLGAVTTPKDHSLRLDLIWESLKEQPLKYKTFVHILDSRKNILGQADYFQDREKRVVKKGTIWHDFLEFRAKDLRDAEAIGIGIYLSPDKLLMTDRGPTDWDKRRLVIRIR
jgi:hypothetical protein